VGQLPDAEGILITVIDGEQGLNWMGIRLLLRLEINRWI